jgi:hypothetical protein
MGPWREKRGEGLHIFGYTEGWERYPEVSFSFEGDSVTGRIVTLNYFRGTPDHRIVLELTPGDESTRRELWAGAKSDRLRRAIGEAFFAAGARTLEIGADLTVTFTGHDTYPYQAAYLYEATYVRPKDRSFASVGDSVVRPEDDGPFESVGDSVDGRIVSIKHVDPSVRIVLELTRGDKKSRVKLWAQSERLRGAIGKAFFAAGALSLELGADLTVTFTGYDGGAKEYEAAYERPGEREEKELRMKEAAEILCGIWDKAASDEGEGEDETSANRLSGHYSGDGGADAGQGRSGR